MCSNLILILTALTIVTVVQSIHVFNDEFINKIQSNCYWRVNGFSKPIPLLIPDESDPNSVHLQSRLFKYGPQSMSIETLIALIEKIEVKRPNLNAKQLALALLRRYRTDDLTFSNGFFEIPSDMKIQYKIESSVFNVRNNEIDTSIIDDILSEDENCTMHYLLSHNIDVVSVNNEDRGVVNVFNNSTNKMTTNQSEITSDEQIVEFKPRFRIVNLPNGTQLTKKPREYGVGTFRQNGQQAILLNKLLLGVVAGLSNPSKVTVEELFYRVRHDLNISDVKLNIKSEVDPLMAVTLAAVLSYGAYTDEQITENLFGANGMWNSTLCSTEYDLNVDTEIKRVNDIPGVAATMAEIRGALDGYNIGEALREMMRIRPQMNAADLKLSQILRYYYSPTGYEPETTAFGYCQRNKTKFEMMDIISEAQSLKRLSILLSKGAVHIEDSFATAPIEKVKLEFFRNLRIAKEIAVEDRHWCAELDRHTDRVPEAICESRSDVFILMDHNQPEDKLELQYSIIDSLVKELNIHRFGDSLSVLALSQNTSSPQRLQRIVWNATSKGCATCRVAFANLRSFKDLERYEHYPRIINTELTEVEEITKSEIAVASRIFITMKFGSKERAANSRIIMEEIKKLKAKHRELQFLLVGDQIKGETNEGDYFSTETETVRQITQKLVGRICEAPATFQYEECNTEISNEVIYNGYITPGRVQHWAIYANDFYKSSEVSFKFESKFGKLVVCIGRTPNEHLEHKTGVCFETSEMTSTKTNPCGKATSETCPPFYFTIYGKSGAEQMFTCTDEHCLNMKQIPFTFTHTGLTCNNSFSADLSPILLIFGVLVTLLLNNR